MKSRYACGALAAALALTLGLSACGGAANAPGAKAPANAEQPSAVPAPAGDETVYDLRVGQMGNGIKAAMVVLAHEMGYYEEEGLNVTLEQISNLNDGLTAITTGKLDILPFGVIPTCTFVAQGADLSIIGGTISEGSACVALPERAEEFSGLEGFAGKTVACVRPETGHMLMKARLREAGVEAEFVELDGFQSVVEAVRKGNADVGFVNSGFERNAEIQGLAVPFFVGEYAPDAVCCRQTASASAVAENREPYIRFETATLRALLLMLDDPETTIDKLTAFSGQDRDYVEYCIYNSAMKISLDPGRDRVVEFYEIMRANGDLPPDAPDDMAEHVDVTIYRDALARLAERLPGDDRVAELLKSAGGDHG